MQFELNDGQPVAMSIPATEHSVMTAWHTERQALQRMIQEFGTGLFACVMDSYDYVQARATCCDVERAQMQRGIFLMKACFCSCHKMTHVHGCSCNPVSFLFCCLTKHTVCTLLQTVDLFDSG